MKDRYQEEMSHIHVSKELLEKTKKAMKEEEEKEKKKRKLLSFRTISIAAAAVCLCILVPVAFGGLGRNASGRPPVRLSSQEQGQLNKIGKKESNTIEIKKVSEMPEDFDGAKETMINGTAVFTIKDDETGYIKAYFEEGQIGYEILSKMTEEEEFEEAVLDYLK